jgi:hypothetical protein
MRKRRYVIGIKHLQWRMRVQRNQVPSLRLGFSSFVNAKILEKFYGFIGRTLRAFPCRQQSHN